MGIKMQKCAMVYNGYRWVTEQLDAIGTWLPQLVIRIILAWEFGEAGFEKLHGTNWFADITFPFPFNLLPPDISWNIALTFEIVGAFAILFGLATRFFAASLFILTIVAIAAVHWPEHWNTFSELFTGYRIVDEEGDSFGNYKLPLIYMVMFLPLIFSGAGKLSVDNFLGKFCKIKHQ
jgi:putative oxidoreductase